MRFAALALLLAASPALADFIAVTYTYGRPLLINETTHQATFFGTSLPDQLNANSMARGPDGRIWVNGAAGGNERLYTLDPITGQYTFQVQTDIDDFRALAFAPNGTLYAIRHDFQQIYHSLYTINLTTGESTLIGYNSAGPLIQGMTFTSDGTCYGWGDPVGLVTINTTTGVASANHGPTGNFGFQSLTTAPGDILYGSGIYSPTLQTRVARINAQSSALVSTFDVVFPPNTSITFQDLRGMEWLVPAPGTWIAAIPPLLFAARRRRATTTV